MGTIHAVLSWWDSFDVLVTPVTLEIGMLQQATGVDGPTARAR